MMTITMINLSKLKNNCKNMHNYLIGTLISLLNEIAGFIL